MKRFIAVAVLVALGLMTHERAIESAEVVAVGQETIDIGDHVVAVLDRDARVAYEVRRSALRGERVTIEQRSGRAIYRVREGALDVRSGGDVVEMRGNAVIVVDGARYAVAEGAAASALREDASLLRWIDEVNDGSGGDLVERLAELERMRAELPVPMIR